MNHLICCCSYFCVLFSRLREKEVVYFCQSLPLNIYLPYCTGLLFPLFLVSLFETGMAFINPCQLAESTYFKWSLSVINRTLSYPGTMTKDTVKNDSEWNSPNQLTWRPEQTI